MKLAVDSMNNIVLLGLSGGVDSTAAALLLQEKGYVVIGFFFDVTGDPGHSANAEATAKELGIQYVYRNVAKEFEEKIISNFCSEYLKGRTPNPCVLCNPLIKFKTMLVEAERVGAVHIATGHYARVSYVSEIGRYAIFKGANKKKDQSYMLYGLDQNVLSNVLFPLGEIENKEDTRNLLRAENLRNSETKDSQEICFIKDRNYVQFIKNHGYNCPGGRFVDREGHDLGNNEGLLNFTVGQRKGLGVTFGKPQYVIRMDAQSNTVMLGDEKDLFKSTIYSLCNLDLFALKDPNILRSGIKATAKIRYAAVEADVTISLDETNSKNLRNCMVKAVFEEPQRAATPGQSIVFYSGDMLLGGGIIEKAE